jgi:biotin carboxylase
MRHVPEASCEEYITGEEFTFDTVCIGGKPAYENIARTCPSPSRRAQNEWISPVIITVRDMYQPKLIARRRARRATCSRPLGMGDGFTHMEWFLTPKGEAVFGEIGCRPGGAHLVDQMNYTSDIDLFREWARVATWRSFEAHVPAQVQRRHRLQARARAGPHHAHHRPRRLACRLRPARGAPKRSCFRPGQPRRNWKHTLLSDGFIILRHPDWRVANEMANIAATEITLYAE